MARMIDGAAVNIVGRRVKALRTDIELYGLAQVLGVTVGELFDSD